MLVGSYSSALARIGATALNKRDLKVQEVENLLDPLGGPSIEDCELESAFKSNETFDMDNCL